MFLEGVTFLEKILVIIVLCMFIFMYAGTIYLMINSLIELFNKERTKRKEKGKEK